MQAHRPFGPTIAHPLATDASPGAKPAPVSPVRAVFCGVAGVVLLCWMTPYTDLVVRGSWLAYNCLPIGALLLLLGLVTGVNRLLRRVSPHAMLTRAELLLVYAMMLVASGIPSVGLAQTAIPLVVAPTHYASVHTEWPTVLFPYIPRWLRIEDAAAVHGFYHGLRAGERVPWGVWLVPLGAWAVHAVLLYAAFLFLVLLLHRPWVEHERLTFPLVQMPLEIVGRDPAPVGNRAFLRSGMMWAGMLVALGIHSLNSLHHVAPGIPAAMQMVVPLGGAFTQSPWHVLRRLRLFVHFSAIGLTYLLAGNVSLSLWFFWVMAKAEMVVLAALGFEGAETQANVTLTPLWFVSIQMWGALLAYGAYLVWDGYRMAARDWPRRAAGSADLSPRGAVAGFAVCVLLLTGWNMAAGGTFALQIAALVAWILSMVALSRLVCAGGLMLIDTNWLPADILYRCLGQTFVRPRDLAALAQYGSVFTWWPQLNMMPFLFSGVRATYGDWRRDRTVVKAMAVAILVAIPVSFATTLWLAYHHGALKLNEWQLGGRSRGDLQALVGYLQSPTDLQWHALGSMGLGAAVMLGMVALQRSASWWPFSPLGYLVGGSFTVMDRLWFCTFVGWAANALVRRYGGLRGYVRFRPFFLGLILGEFAAAALWLAVDAALGITDHSILP